MSVKEITARVGKEENAPSVTVTYDMGDNLPEAIEKFGADVVYKRFEQSLTIEIQAIIRRHMSGEKPKSESEIQAIIAEFSPGLQRARKTSKEKALDLLADLSEADREEILKSLAAA